MPFHVNLVRFDEPHAVQLHQLEAGQLAPCLLLPQDAYHLHTHAQKTICRVAISTDLYSLIISPHV